jgi:hypothetical protein
MQVGRMRGTSHQMNGSNIAKIHDFTASGESSFTCLMSSIFSFSHQ